MKVKHLLLILIILLIPLCHFAKKIHTLWVTLIPNFIIDSLNMAYSNIEYPKRVISSLLQRDIEAVTYSISFKVKSNLDILPFEAKIVYVSFTSKILYKSVS